MISNSFLFGCVLFFSSTAPEHIKEQTEFSDNTNRVFENHSLHGSCFFSNIYLKEALEVLICVSFGAVAIPVFFVFAFKKPGKAHIDFETFSGNKRAGNIFSFLKQQWLLWRKEDLWQLGDFAKPKLRRLSPTS